MSELSYMWYGFSDQAISRKIGEYVKHHRLQLNKSQEETSKAAGISRSTLSLLERGETVTLATLIQVLRAIEKLEVLNNFAVIHEVSPMMLAEMEMKYRKRSRRKSNDTDTQSSDW